MRQQALPGSLVFGRQEIARDTGRNTKQIAMDIRRIGALPVRGWFYRWMWEYPVL